VVLNRTHGFDAQRADALAQDLPECEAERVLLTQDGQRDQGLLVEALSRAGFEVDAAADGPHALRRARETACAALASDRGLSG
jgi:CheY-like chemotaxis protein